MEYRQTFSKSPESVDAVQSGYYKEAGSYVETTRHLGDEEGSQLARRVKLVQRDKVLVCIFFVCITLF